MTAYSRARPAGNWQNLGTAGAAVVDGPSELEKWDQALYELKSAGAPGYTVSSNGTTVTGRDPAGVLVSTGTDLGAVMTAIFAVLPATGGTISFQNTGSVFPQATIPLIPKSISSLLYIEGNGSTVQLSATGYTFLSFARSADYDTWQNVWVNGFVIDGNNADPAVGVPTGVVVGVTTATRQRINADNLRFTNILSKNVPVLASGSQRIHYQVMCYHPATGETQTNLTNISVRHVRMLGGNQGVCISGESADTTCNVFHDSLHVDDWYFDSLVTPTTNKAGVGVQYGSKGFGNRCSVTNGYCKNSSDVCVEIDSFTLATTENVESVDSLKIAFLYRNFHAPEDWKKQVGVFRNCTARYVNITPNGSTTDQTKAFMANNTSVVSATYGHIIIDKCQVYTTTLKLDTIQGFALNATALLQRLTVTDFRVSCIGIADTSTGSQFNDLILISPTSQCILKMARVWIQMSGSTSNAACRFRAFEVTGNTGSVYFEIDDVDIDVTLTGFTAFLSNGLLVGASTGNMSGAFRRIRFLNWTDDTGPSGILISSSATLTILGKITVENCDFNGLAGGGTEINVNANQVTQVFASHNRWKNKPVPSTLAGLTTATGQALGKLYPVLVSFVQGSGAAVTAIDISTNAGSTYKNILTQASGALPAGFSQTVGPLPTDALVKVTFTTTQPTINLIPVDA